MNNYFRSSPYYYSVIVCESVFYADFYAKNECFSKTSVEVEQSIINTNSANYYK